jgi:hypothetical protein
VTPSNIRKTGPLVLLLAVTLVAAYDPEHNGFDLEGSLVPPEEIHLGGPARDGIPAIDRPEFISAERADFLSPEDRVLGLTIGETAKAYPIAIMNWHEIVNDCLGGERVALTYCPLCGTGVAFAAEAEGRELSFGVSGLLYNSGVLLYDRQTESLWSQIRRQAISGPMRGERLEVLPLTHTTWQAWQQDHPDTLVLSTDTGFRRDYDRDPYTGYGAEAGLYFPVANQSRRYHPKERVLGLEIDGRFKAYPFAELSRIGAGEIDDRFAGRTLTIRFDADAESARAFDSEGNQLPAIVGFWFAWYAFHPGTEVLTAEP